MKKSIKIVLIVLASLIGLIGLTFGGIFIWYKHEVKKQEDNVVETPEELIAIRDFSLIVYDSIPNEISESIVLKTEFKDYEDFIIAYTSSNPKYLSNTGVVNRDLEDHFVTLKYKISYKEYSSEYEKTVKVLKTNNKITANKVLSILEKQINPNVNEGTVLPETIEDFADVQIIWDKEVINRDSGKIETSIQIIEKDGKLVLHFEPSKEKEICFINLTIKINGMDFHNNLIIYTKTNI